MSVPRRGRFQLIRRPRRIIAILLCFLLLITGSLQQSLDSYARALIDRHVRQATDARAAPAPVNTLPETEPLSQIAPPSPSGAYAPYPLNHTLDAETVYPGGEVANFDFEAPAQTVGTPPINHDLSSSPTTQGTQLTNSDFAAGAFTGWTAGTGVTIQASGGPEGDWAQLASSGTLTSDAFTPESDAQAITFDYGAFHPGATNTLAVTVHYGASYGSSTVVANVQCGNCNQWGTVQFGIGQWKGQSIKLRFTRLSGTVGVDRITKQILFPGFETDGNVARIEDSGDGYASIADKLTSAPFTVDPTAQHVTLSLRGLTAGSDQAYLKVLSGPTYSTVTTLVPNFTDSWATYRFNLAAFSGQSIKLQVDAISGRVAVDEVGVMRIDAPDWSLGSGTAVPVAGDTGGTAILVSGQLDSSAVTLPADVQQLTIRYKTAASSLYWELLTGPTYSTVVQLGSLVSNGVWATARVGVSDYRGQSVKLRVRAQLAAVTVDDVGVLENVIPGWQIVQQGVAAVGTDANGTYVSSATTNGTLKLESSPVSPGFLDGPGAVDLRSALIGYSWSSAQNSMLRVEYTALDGSNYYLLGNFFSGTANTYQTVRVGIYDFMAAPGKFTLTLFNGARLYSIGDNIARQQLAEPFSQQVGDGIDTSTGSYGTRETDLTVSGGPLPLVFTRYYHAHSDRLGSLGYRWSHSYDTELAIQPDGSVAVVFGSGHEEFFEWNNFYSTFAPGDPRIKSTLTVVTGQPYTYLYETKSGLKYAFTGNGDLISITDRNSQSIVLYRDVNNRVTSITDPAGREITLTYDGSGRLATATDPESAVVTYGYDGTGDLTSVDKPEDARTEYGYSRHRLTAIRVRTGETLATSQMTTVVSNTLDAFNRVVAQTDSLSNTISLSYQDPGAGVTTVTDALSEVTAYHFDAHARTTFVDYPADGDSGFSYTADGYLDTITNGANQSYDFGYTGAANPDSVEDPLGNPIAIAWGLDNLPTSVTDARGTVTVNSYDSQGNLRQVIRDPHDAGDPDTELDLMTRYEVNGEGLVTREVVDPAVDWQSVSRGSGRLNLITDHEYDADNNRIRTIIDPTDPSDGDSELNLVWEWTYDDAGRVLTETDPDGRTTTYEYDILGRILVVRHVRNSTAEDIDIVYDITGKIVLLEDALGNQWEWRYDLDGRVTKRIDSKNNEWDYAYDDNDNLISVTNPDGIVTAYAYDENNRVTSQAVDPTDADPDTDLNLVTSQSYDVAGRVETVTNPLGDIWEYGYNANGQVINLTLPNTPVGGVYDFFYDENGNPTGFEDPYGNDEIYVYDRANRLVSTTDRRGTVTTYTYDAAGRRTSVTEDAGTGRLNLTTSSTYDAANRLATVTDPRGKVTTYGYDGAGNVTSVTDDDGNTTAYTYDVYNRLTSITDPLLRTTGFVYDAAGRHITTIDPSLEEWDFTYDERYLLLTETDPEGNQTSYGYDDLGRLGSVQNGRSYTTVYAYDAADRLVSVTDAQSNVLSYQYDAASNLTAVTNPRTYMTSYTHDELGNVLTTTNALNDVWTNTYDVMGRLDVAEDARGITVDYGYDAASTVTSLVPSTGGSVGYTYDALGRQSSISDPTGTTEYTYDAAGNVLEVESPQGDVSYTYDDLNRRATMTLPNTGQTVEYGYDDAGQLIELTDWSSATAIDYTWTDTGTIDTISRPNGVTSNYDYDLASRLLAVEHNNGGSLLARYASTLDANGNRTQTIVTGSAVPNRTETAIYDEIDQLTTATYGPSDSVTYTYDDNGNRLSQVTGGQTTSYTYNAIDSLTATGGAFVSTSGYDDNGNRTSVSYGSGGTDSFSYDWNNRLSQATVGGSTVDYAYTGDDLRASRTENSVTETYLWDRLSALPTMVDDGTTQSVHGPSGITTEINGTTVSYALPDGLGSVRAWAGSGGTAVGATDWDVWGNVRSTSGSVGLHGYTGERADPASGLVYLRARDYSPGTARFVQPDPIQPNAEGTHGYNTYWYANNNPATVIDPTGTQGAVLGWAQVGFQSFSRPGGSIGYRLALGGVLRGVASALIIIGALPAWVFVVVALVLILALAIYLNETWCQSHDCTLGALAGWAGGWIETITTAGKTEVKMGWTGMVTGAAAACVLAAAFTPSLLPQPVAQGCGVPDECTRSFVRDVVTDVLWEGIELVDPIGAVPVFRSVATGGESDGCGGGQKKSCNVDPPLGNPQPPAGNGVNPPPGGSAVWRWVGNGKPGSPDGAWVRRDNKKVSWRWDAGSGGSSTRKEGPHWDYRDGSNKKGYRYYPNENRWEDKDVCP